MPKKTTDDSKKATQGAPRRRYAKPQLSRFGLIRSVTRGGSAFTAENAFMMGTSFQMP